MNLTRVTEGEIYGAPVPSGWPDRGPFRFLGDALGKLFRRPVSAHREPVVERPDFGTAEPDE